MRSAVVWQASVRSPRSNAANGAAKWRTAGRCKVEMGLGWGMFVDEVGVFVDGVGIFVDGVDECTM